MTLTPESEALLARWREDVEREREGRTGYLDWDEVTDRLAAIEAAAATAERERIAAALPDALGKALWEQHWSVEINGRMTGALSGMVLRLITEHPAVRAILAPEGDA